jgi:hypothetical protein
MSTVPVPVTAPEASAAPARGLALVALASVAFFAVSLVALHLLRPDVPPLVRGISNYANGPAGALVRVAAAVLGAGGLALTAGLFLCLTPVARSRAGIVLLGLWSAAQLATAAFPIDPPGATATSAGTIHGLAGLSFVLPVFAALLLARGYPRDPRWAGVARPALALGFALLAASVVLYVLLEPLAGVGFGGLAQRVYWLVLLAWLACTALWLRAAASPAGGALAPEAPVPG